MIKILKNKKVRLKKIEPSLILKDIEVGSPFVLDGVEFVKLCEDCGASFVITADVVLIDCAFCSDRETGRNNFAGSKVESALNQWLSKHGTIDENVVERPIDLTSVDGITDYGCPMVRARILTLDEYRRYRKYIPEILRTYWLATPWRIERYEPPSFAKECFVTRNGDINWCLIIAEYLDARLALWLDSETVVG